MGHADYTNTQFCTDTEPSGHMCSEFVSHEEFPITVTADKHQAIHLDAVGVPDGGYVKFIPDIVDTDTKPSVSKMVIAGIMEPFGINLYDTTAMAMRARSTDGSIALEYVQIIDRGGITILSKPGPIKLEGNVISSGSQTQIIPFGVVCDPSNGPRTLPVKLEALGLVNGSAIVPFTPSFSVKIPRDSFVLNATEPYFFMVESLAKSLPSRKITFALGQEIGEQHFIQNITLNISNIQHGGVNSFSIGSPMPEHGSMKLEQVELNKSSDSWTIPAIIGLSAGGGGGIFSFLLLKGKQG